MTITRLTVDDFQAVRRGVLAKVRKTLAGEGLRTSYGETDIEHPNSHTAVFAFEMVRMSTGSSLTMRAVRNAAGMLDKIEVSVCQQPAYTHHDFVARDAQSDYVERIGQLVEKFMS